MKHVLACVMIGAMFAGAAADRTTVAGQWVLTALGDHAVQLGLELKQDGRTVTGRLIVMGHTVDLDGEFADGNLSMSGEGGSTGGHLDGTVKLTATMKDDGTLEGVLRTQKASLSWTAERFTERKK